MEITGKALWLNRKSRGITLIELLIALALIGIIASGALSMQLFGIKTFKKGENASANQFDVRMAAEFITRELRYAKTVEILYNVPTPATGYNDIYLSGGKIKYYKNGVLSQSTAFASTTDFKLFFSRVSDNMLGFIIGKQGETKYDIDSKVAILNISAATPYKIKYSPSGTGIGVRYSLGELNDSQAVHSDNEWLQIPNASNITASIYLPTEGPNKTRISWASNNTAVITANGTVTRPSGSDASMILTATITRGTVSLQKTFNLVVKKLDASLTIIKINNISETVFQNQIFDMPKTVEAQMSDGSVQYRSITWNPVSISTATPGTKTSNGTVAGYGSNITLTLIVKGAAPPVGQISGSNSSTQFRVVFDKTISSVSISSNNTGKTVSTSISGNTVTVNFSGSVGNNNNVVLKFTSTDGGYTSYTFVYKNKGAWR